MKIIRIQERHFLATAREDLHDIALKVLNDLRVSGGLEPQTQDFAEKVCDAIDGDLAWELLSRITEVEIITPEMNR